MDSSVILLLLFERSKKTLQLLTVRSFLYSLFSRSARAVTFLERKVTKRTCSTGGLRVVPSTNSHANLHLYSARHAGITFCQRTKSNQKCAVFTAFFCPQAPSSMSPHQHTQGQHQPVHRKQASIQ